MVLMLFACGTETYCKEVDAFDLADEEATPFGYTPADVLAGVEGARDTSALRRDGNTTEATVTVARAEGPAVFRVFEEASRLTLGGMNDVLVHCREGTLEIPARVEVETADGDFTFAEEGVASAAEDGPEVAEAGGTWPAREVEGMPVFDDRTPDEAWANVRFDGGTLVSGQLGWQGVDASWSSWGSSILTIEP